MGLETGSLNFDVNEVASMVMAVSSNDQSSNGQNPSTETCCELTDAENTGGVT